MLEVIEIFKYLLSLVTAVGRVEAEGQQRVMERSEALAEMTCDPKGRNDEFWGKEKIAPAGHSPRGPLILDAF